MTRNADVQTRFAQTIALARTCAPSRFLLLALMLALIPGLCACGRQTAGPEAGKPPAADSAILPPASAGALPGIAELDSLPLSAAPRQGAGVTAPNIRSFTGGEYLIASDGVDTPADSSWVSFATRNTRPEYVIYAVDGLSEQLSPAAWQLNIVSPANWAGRPCIALANYASGRWELRETAADGVYRLPGGAADYISPGGRAYVAVIGALGEQPGGMHIYSGHLTLEDGSPLPAPVLSPSAYPGGIALHVKNYYDLRAEALELEISGPGVKVTRQLTLLSVPFHSAGWWTPYYEDGLSAGELYDFSLRAVRGAGAPSASAEASAVPEHGWIATYEAPEFFHYVGAAPDGAEGYLAIGSAGYGPEEHVYFYRFTAAGEVLEVQSLPQVKLISASAGAAGLYIAGLDLRSQPWRRFVARLGSGALEGWALEPEGGVSSTDIATDDSGNCYLSCNGDHSAPGSLRIFKLSGSAGLLWARSYTSGDGPLAGSVITSALSSDAELLVSCWLSGQNALLRLRPDASLRWARGSAELAIRALAPAPGGGCYAGSWPEAGSLLSIAADGTLGWARRFEASAAASYDPLCLSPGPDGSVWAACHAAGANRLLCARLGAAGEVLAASGSRYYTGASPIAAHLLAGPDSLLLCGGVNGELRDSWESFTPPAAMVAELPADWQEPVVTVAALQASAAPLTLELLPDSPAPAMGQLHSGSQRGCMLSLPAN